MLYLMMDKTDKEYLVKVGFTDKNKPDARRKQYYSYNPRAIMRSTCAGNVSAEQACHLMLGTWGGIRIPGTEWFSVSKGLFDAIYQKGMGAFRPELKRINFLEKF